MAEDSCAAIFMIEKLGQEDMYRCTEGVKREVTDIFREREEGECHAKRQMRESRLAHGTNQKINIEAADRKENH